MSATRTYIKNDDGNFVCPYCGDIKKRQNTMLYHMDKCAGKLPHQCGQCKKAFVQKRELQLHILKWHPEPTAASIDICCPFDGCTFKNSQKGNVRTHCMRMHVSEYMDGILIKDIDGTWNCSMCGICCQSAPKFYYHLYKCMLDMDVIPANSEAATKLAVLG